MNRTIWERAMNTRNCQECSEQLPSWAGFCPFCGEKFRATAMLTPVSGPGEIEGPVKTQLLYLGTTSEGFDPEAEPETKAERDDATVVRPHRTEKIQSASVMVNHAALARFDEPAPKELDDWVFDEEPVSLRTRGQLVVATLAAVVTVAALIAGAVVLTSDAPAAIATNGTAAIARTVEDAPEKKPAPLPDLLEFDVRAEGPSHASIYYGAKQILELKTAEGSRYDTVEQRARSVTVRLTHVAQKQREERLENGRFVARMNGDRYEVVWDDGSKHPFRIKDLTSHDVKKKGQMAIDANLQADALTDLFRTKIAPSPRPNT
jgi:hypothetical protein